MVGADAAHGILHMSPSAAVTLGSVLGGALLAAYTELTNTPLRALAKALTDHENHRTQTAHDDALILKTCLFLFTNSYASLVYVAFVKARCLTTAAPPQRPATPPRCLPLAVAPRRSPTVFRAT